MNERKMTGQQIAEAVDRIINGIEHLDRQGMGAINWGDLGVCEVREITCLWPEPDDEHQIEVLIEEADPSNYQFAEFIVNRFHLEFGFYIHVLTEW
jgi:hypothetical protein